MQLIIYWYVANNTSINSDAINDDTTIKNDDNDLLYQH